MDAMIELVVVAFFDWMVCADVIVESQKVGANIGYLISIP
jgi:hypothetical protein